MPVRPRKNTKSTALKLAELAVAVPQVVGHRLTRMALAGPVLSPRDRREFNRMVAEKHSAFQEACTAMVSHSLHANQAMATNFLMSLWAPAAKGRPSVGKTTAQLQRATLGVIGRGLDPVHRKAVANAKRLAKTKLR
jgi:hypothetical protein